MNASTPPRKTCDNCYLRKIKCDRQQPQCSHCVTYNTECTYAAPSRPSQHRPRIRKQSVAPDTTKTNPSMSSLLAFIERLQTQVTELTQRLDNNKDSQMTPQQPQQQEPPAMSTVALSDMPTSTPPPFIPVAMSASDSAESSVPSTSSTMTLPPSHEIMPIIRIFFDNFNAVMPLFQPKDLLNLINGWYALPHQRDPVSWAAINVVLALTYKQNLAGNSGVVDIEDENLAAVHLSRAQSVISAVIFGDTALLNVQVLVGMTMLLQASKNLKPSLVLIATAMRLAHSLGLHTRAAVPHLEPDVARQHAHVFWLAYILDKDLSMRARQPSIQRDDDIDIDMPTSIVGDSHPLNRGEHANDDLLNDNLGEVTTLSGDARVNYFQARIRLASIQGGIYDYLYSARSQARSTSERAVALESLVHALEEWKLSIPAEFGVTAVPKTLSRASLSFFCVLHATNFACLTMINQANAWNEQWMQSLRNACKQSTQLRLPSRWEPLVKDARDFVALFEIVPPTGYSLIWETTCSYLTAATLLAANNASRPFDDQVLTDMGLVKNAVKFIDDLTTRGRIGGHEQLQMVRNTCLELSHSALRKRNETLAMGFDNFSIF